MNENLYDGERQNTEQTLDINFILGGEKSPVNHVSLLIHNTWLNGAEKEVGLDITDKGELR